MVYVMLSINQNNNDTHNVTLFNSSILPLSIPAIFYPPVFHLPTKQSLSRKHPLNFELGLIGIICICFRAPKRWVN